MFGPNHNLPVAQYLDNLCKLMNTESNKLVFDLYVTDESQVY